MTKRFILAAALLVVTITTIGSTAVTVDASSKRQVLIIVAQTKVNKQTPRDVDLDTSAPNKMTPEMSKEMHDFRRVGKYLPALVIIVVASIIGALLFSKKKDKKPGKHPKK